MSNWQASLTKEKPIKLFAHWSWQSNNEISQFCIFCVFGKTCKSCVLCDVSNNMWNNVSNQNDPPPIKFLHTNDRPSERRNLSLPHYSYDNLMANVFFSIFNFGSPFNRTNTFFSPNSYIMVFECKRLFV